MGRIRTVRREWGAMRVGVDGWHHPFRMLKHAGTPDVRGARFGSWESTNKGCPQVSTCGTRTVGVDG
jgi:hypothetical protein